MNSLRSSLAAHAGSMRDPDPESMRRFAAQMHEKTGIIILDPEWIDSWGDREFVKAIASKVHKKGASGGKRR